MLVGLRDLNYNLGYKVSWLEISDVKACFESRLSMLEKPIFVLAARKIGWLFCMRILFCYLHNLCYDITHEEK